MIVGLGHIGKRHLQLVREMHPDFKIVVLRHKPTIEVPNFANYVCGSIEEAIRYQPEFAIISNPAPFHLDIAKILVNQNCNLLIEKPLSTDSNGIKELIDFIRDRSVICQIGYNLRFAPSLIEFRRLIKEKIIGRPLIVRSEVGQYLPDWRVGKDYRLTVSARKNLGGGVLLELSHEIDYIRWIFGDVKWVCATLSKTSNLELDVEDSASLILGMHESGQQKELITTLNMDFVRRDYSRQCIVIGSDGTLKWDGLDNSVSLFDTNSKKWEVIFNSGIQKNDSYKSQWLHFLTCVKNSEQPIVKAEDGLAVLNIIESARQSNLYNQSRFYVRNV